jgi:SAM-dependent methyltransferase
MRIGKKFFENYFSSDMTSVLEVGAYDVNGSLKSVKPQNSKWTGIDIEEGPGVDIVVQPGQKFPFPDEHFDLVVATSVFEHDPAFWKTLAEMARVLKKTGFMYVCAPSNGLVHRYPLDCFRFYPDASQSFLSVVREVAPNAVLSESFVGEQDHENLWNDYVAVIANQPIPDDKVTKIYKSEKSSNIWDGETFLESSFVATPEDRRNSDRRTEELSELRNINDQIALERDALWAERDALLAERDALLAERDAIYNTRTFRWTKQLRKTVYKIRNAGRVQ